MLVFSLRAPAGKWSEKARHPAGLFLFCGAGNEDDEGVSTLQQFVTVIAV